MKTSVIEVHAMLSVFSVDDVEKRIGEVPGVESVTVNYAAGSATVRYDETRLEVGDIKSAVRQRGYESDHVRRRFAGRQSRRAHSAGRADCDPGTRCTEHSPGRTGHRERRFRRQRTTRQRGAGRGAVDTGSYHTEAFPGRAGTRSRTRRRARGSRCQRPRRTREDGPAARHVGGHGARDGP